MDGEREKFEAWCILTMRWSTMEKEDSDEYIHDRTAIAWNAWQARASLPSAQPQEPDINKCPSCGGEADNGHDRCYPPNPYYCTKCTSAQPSDVVVEASYEPWPDPTPEMLETPEFNKNPNISGK